MTEAKGLSPFTLTRFDEYPSINFGNFAGWLADEEVQIRFAISSLVLLPHLFHGLPATVPAVHE